MRCPPVRAKYGHSEEGSSILAKSRGYTSFVPIRTGSDWRFWNNGRQWEPGTIVEILGKMPHRGKMLQRYYIVYDDEDEERGVREDWVRAI